MSSFYDPYDNDAMRANANYSHMTGKIRSHESFQEPDYEDNPSDMVNHPDQVNSPPHYTIGGIEAIKVIEAKLGGKSNEAYRGYLMGNVMKYLMRSTYKGKRLEDCRKAEYYLKELIDCIDQD